jgi:hypothetical protein
MCRPSGTLALLDPVPGTAVPGYRLFRPCGTRILLFVRRSLEAGSSAVLIHAGIEKRDIEVGGDLNGLDPMQHRTLFTAARAGVPQGRLPMPTRSPAGDATNCSPARQCREKAQQHSSPGGTAQVQPPKTKATSDRTSLWLNAEC